MFERWTRRVVRYRALVLALWLLIAALGVASTVKLPDLLTTSLNVPGSNSARANEILGQRFHDNIEGSFAVVVPASSREADVPSDVRRAIQVIPGAIVTQQRRVDSTWYLNVDTPLSLGRAADATATLRNALQADGVTNALVTGPPALQHDIAPVLSSDLRRGEVVTALVALIVLLIALGLTWAVALPFLVAGATTSLALLVLYLLSHEITMVLYVPNIVELFGLGLALDYSLLIVHRFRGELDDPAVSVEDAIVTTLATTGRTIAFSGFAVAIALGTLILVPVPFVRSLSLAALCVPLAGIIGAVTLQPALLSLWGRSGVRTAATPWSVESKFITRILGTQRPSLVATTQVGARGLDPRYRSVGRITLVVAVDACLIDCDSALDEFSESHSIGDGRSRPRILDTHRDCHRYRTTEWGRVSVGEDRSTTHGRGNVAASRCGDRSHRKGGPICKCLGPLRTGLCHHS